jgi:hypothetical protein
MDLFDNFRKFGFSVFQFRLSEFKALLDQMKDLGRSRPVRGFAELINLFNERDRKRDGLPDHLALCHNTIMNHFGACGCRGREKQDCGFTSCRTAPRP